MLYIKIDAARWDEPIILLMDQVYMIKQDEGRLWIYNHTDNKHEITLDMGEHADETFEIVNRPEGHTSDKEDAYMEEYNLKSYPHMRRLQKSTSL